MLVDDLLHLVFQVLNLTGNILLVKQKGYYLLDSAPETLSAKDHRPAYGTDGDYFSKPSMDDIIEKTYEIMHEFDPEKYPSIY